jgi:hypothetical protein
MVSLVLFTALLQLSVLASATPKHHDYTDKLTSDKCINSLEYSLSDERKFRELSYRWTHAWDQKVLGMPNASSLYF